MTIQPLSEPIMLTEPLTSTVEMAWSSSEICVVVRYFQFEQNIYDASCDGSCAL